MIAQVPAFSQINLKVTQSKYESVPLVNYIWIHCTSIDSIYKLKTVDLQLAFSVNITARVAPLKFIFRIIKDSDVGNNIIVRPWKYSIRLSSPGAATATSATPALG